MNGTVGNEDEIDLFDDDDDFDDLSESALQELEQHAILSTQQQSLQRNALVKPTSYPPPRSNLTRRLPNLSENYLEDESFELLGDEGVATPVEEYASFIARPQVRGETAQREQFRQQRYGDNHFRSAPTLNRQQVQQQIPAAQATPSDGRYPGVSTRLEETMIDQPSQRVNMPPAGGHMLLGDQLEDLLRERDQLAKDLRAANDAMSMQKGEISIIRANAEKENKVYDRQLNALKKSIEEETIKHQAAMDAIAEKNRQLTTRYQFLQQEHNQEVQDVKALKQRLKDRPEAEQQPTITSTPKRGMGGSLRDGFEDDDIMLLSPSKSARRSKPSTPTAANRRKRKAGGTSPVKSLPLRLSAPDPLDMAPPRPPVPQPEDHSQITIRRDPRAERDLLFLQKILDYRVKPSREMLLESLMKISLPSRPSKTFSSILLERIAHMKDKRVAHDLLQIFIDLWSKSLKEQYYQPISLLIEIVGYIIEVEMFVLTKENITTLVPLLRASIALNAEKRFKHSPVNHSSFGKFSATPQAALNHDVNGTACLELLLDIAYIISDEPELIDLFWRLLDYEFLLMMLNSWQPISDIILNLRLLATSIFPTTFGSIASTPEEQDKIEHWIINRVCWLLWETPKVDEGLPPNSKDQLCQLRLEVMELLTRIAITSSPYPHDDPNHHGSLLIASDAHAIARIVRSLYDEVAAMYLLTPTHTQHAEIVNRGIRVLYHVLTMHNASIDLQEKLSLINGGVHKHRVVLTRLAFSQGFYVDRLITDETVAMATTMLEDSVTPDEADELIEAFPGFRGRATYSQEQGVERMDIEDT
ncbi:hypothetical protein LTR84_005131 [Exophiala bonariae]|uniref:DNA repair protein Rad26 n=1 Tax=Exophiala bonariae TaxID=1690606 RepID=A0AAV9NPA7_9EURO|nr:hypothetical protein LTR84_005131 [Exophiala bonariae]